MTDRTLPVYFDSRRDEKASITIDSRGRYCIVWADERATPAPRIGPNQSASFRQPWRAGPSPPGCQTSPVAIPWHRAEDFHSSWQWRLLMGAALAALALLLCGWALRGRPAVGIPLHAAGAGLALFGAVASLAPW